MVIQRFKMWSDPVDMDIILMAFILIIRSPLLNKIRMKVTIAREEKQLLCFKALADLMSLLMCNFLIAVPARLFCLYIISMNAAISEIGGRRTVNAIFVIAMVME